MEIEIYTIGLDLGCDVFLIFLFFLKKGKVERVAMIGRTDLFFYINCSEIFFFMD